MKAEARAAASGSPVPLPGRQWNRLTTPIRRFPQRLRERRFWQIQVLVAIATLSHYTVETIGFTDPEEALHGLTITLYVVPLLYAALNYGWEGAVLTAVWAAFLTSPSTWLFHRSEFVWLTELGQLFVVLPVGILVAWRVDLEAKQRLRAEKTSSSLSLLNEIGESLSHTLEVEARLPHVVRRLLSGLSLRAVWLCLEPESRQGPILLIQEANTRSADPSATLAPALHERVSRSRSAVTDGPSVSVPLLLESGVMGSLGATVSPDEAPDDEQVELLMTVAHQVAVAVDNARLYRQRQESLQSYVRQVTQAQEDERLRIARDLHDETAQELVSLVRNLELLDESAGPGLTEPISDLLTQARATLRSIRRYSRDLRPSVLDDLGLLAAIEMLVEEANGRLSEGARLSVTGESRRVDVPVELALFRIAQEALRNVEKHAEATSATVELDFSEGEIRLRVTDNGVGFSPPKNISDLAPAGKLGLLGMKERAELVGGTFEARSSPGEGTTLLVRVRHSDRPAG